MIKLMDERRTPTANSPNRRNSPQKKIVMCFKIGVFKPVNKLGSAFLGKFFFLLHL
ncbi:hypothetical protein [Flavobacterium cyanobacteriorum]|uniref:hypothetical protein n=1 Tax=Flavobacterium cyanobacteriorum TaxID=2022802 RepID=UPI0013FE2A6A|nr:hypothetical protein [Flavobacterium cyanobacteriorum]